ncbi:MAG TPA: thiol-disulfide isomerase [Gammaproteobacteria bacterium]|mgnify:CR=1 FL=1|jgi:methylamine dehydrogenase accessory protein MauD|nr:thiol-disulfide isomerase [Gammaproteobacteria bacterium]
MLEALVVSNIILWLVVIVLALLVFALTRQVGILHERVAPAGALLPTSGPKVGELTKELSLTAIDGSSLVIGGASDSAVATFILFISPTCPVCKTLVPTARSLVNSERGRMQLLFASDGDDLEQHKSYVKDLKIDGYPYVLSQALGMDFEVSKLPFAVLIAGDGTLKSKGLVNTREHMESLIESMDSGITTVQEYIGGTKMDDANADYDSSALEQTS